jgi:hypothetical protein
MVPTFIRQYYPTSGTFVAHSRSTTAYVYRMGFRDTVSPGWYDADDEPFGRDRTSSTP